MSTVYCVLKNRISICFYRKMEIKETYLHISKIYHFYYSIWLSLACHQKYPLLFKINWKAKLFPMGSVSISFSQHSFDKREENIKTYNVYTCQFILHRELPVLRCLLKKHWQRWFVCIHLLSHKNLCSGGDDQLLHYPVWGSQAPHGYWASERWVVPLREMT